MKHNCRFNKNGLCGYCGTRVGLTVKENEYYKKDCFSGSDIVWEKLHKKHLKAIGIDVSTMRWLE